MHDGNIKRELSFKMANEDVRLLSLSVSVWKLPISNVQLPVINAVSIPLADSCEKPTNIDNRYRYQTGTSLKTTSMSRFW